MLFQRIKKGDGSKSRERARERERDVISQVIAFRCHAWLRAVKRKITSGIAEQKTSWGGMWKLANYTTRNTCTQQDRQTQKETKEIKCLKKKKEKNIIWKSSRSKNKCAEKECALYQWGLLSSTNTPGTQGSAVSGSPNTEPLLLHSAVSLEWAKTQLIHFF